MTTEYIKDLKINYTRIKVIKNKMNLGAGLSRNIGIKNSKNELIAFLIVMIFGKKIS